MARLAAIGIVTRDIAASVRFYRLLGLDVPDPDDGPHHDVELPGGVRLMWDTAELMQQLDPEREEPRGQRMALAFECGSADEVNATYARLVEAGCEGKKEPYDAPWGQRYANVVDPDGNVVDLFGSVAGFHPPERGKCVACPTNAPTSRTRSSTRS